MPIKPTIRPLTLTTQPAARELILAGLAEHWGIIDPNLNQDVEDLGSFYPDSIFVIKQDGEVLATGALAPIDQKTWQVVRMSVDKRYRRQGLGTMMLKHLIQTARQRGANRLILETTADWNEARQFYRSAGFKFTHLRADDAYYELVIGKE